MTTMDRAKILRILIKEVVEIIKDLMKKNQAIVMMMINTLMINPNTLKVIETKTMTVIILNSRLRIRGRYNLRDNDIDYFSTTLRKMGHQTLIT
jgi:hypothetical protein